MTPDDAAPAVRTEVCDACGQDRSPDARFCRHCGAEVDASDASDAPAPIDPSGTSVVPAPSPSEADTGPMRRATGHGGPGGSTTVGAVGHAGPGCPGCGTANPPGRELCVRCGADLETGVVPPRPSRDRVDAGASTGTVATSGGSRWWLPVLAAVGAVIIVLVTLVAAGVGPFATAPAVPDADFDRATYDAAPQELALTDVATRSTRAAEAGRTFTADQLVDRDPSTAWHADGDTSADGIGETVELFLAEPAWVSEVVIRNGDHLDSDAYEAVARLQRARLTLDGGASAVLVLLDQGREPQVVRLSEPLLTTVVRLDVVETVPGRARADLAISDLWVRGWVADADDAALARERAALLPATGPLPS